MSEDPGIAGGIPRYTVPIAEALVAQGHVVDYVWTGGYLGRYDWRFRRRWSKERRAGVLYHGLLNPESIGMHPGRPELDLDTVDTAVVVEHVRTLRPDVIHVHSFLGLPVNVLRELALLGPVVVSCHDFGLVCQRRVLVQRDGGTCTTFSSQEDCPTCVDVTTPSRYRWRARLRHTPMHLGQRAVNAVERITGHALSVETTPTADTPGESTTGPMADSQLLKAYQQRLAVSVGAINQHARAVLAVSASVRDVLLTCGVDSTRVRVMHIGSGSADRLRPTPLPSETGGRRVSLLYLGGYLPVKGGLVLVDALSRTSAPLDLVFAGGGYDWYERQVRANAGANVGFHGQYRPDELAALLAAADVVVAPAMGPDTSPQAVLEALAAGRPVVGSRIGGIPDFVHDGVNGRLFPPGDRDALAAILQELASADTVRFLAKRVTRPRTVAEHVHDLEQLYAELAE